MRRTCSTVVVTALALAALSLLGPGAAQAATPSLRVLSYNLLQLTSDGALEGGRRVAPWAGRRLAAAALIERARPDVVAVQEGWPPARRPSATPCSSDRHSYHYTGGAVALRYLQVDSLCDALGGRYRRTDTSTGAGGVHPGQGNYLLYDPRRVRPIGVGGFWNLGPGTVTAPAHRTAAFQLFEQLSTHARVLVVSVHLVANRGSAFDALRGAQTAALVAAERSYAHRVGVHSVVLAGDWNAYPGRADAVDTPGPRLRSAGLRDAVTIAGSRVDARFATMNQYRARPPLGGSVDRAYVTGDVAVRRWGQLLTLRRGEFSGVLPSDHNPVYVDLALPP